MADLVTEAVCLDCGTRPGFANRRGLCATCYGRNWRARTLDSYPLLGNRPDPQDSPKAAGAITYRQLDYWTRRGYLKPGNAGAGSGHWRRWSAEERAVAAMMARLIAAGLTVEAAHKVARAGGRVELAPGVVVEVARG